MKRVLVDVDSQFDFVDPAGALYAPAPASVRDNIARALADTDRYAAIIGSVDSHAHDAWEFAANGGPFPAHCVKGSPGWLRVFPQLPPRQRFVPMQSLATGHVANLVGESVAGAGNRVLGDLGLAREALDGVALYFEKEVYSLFANPVAEPIIASLVAELGGPDQVAFEVIGYCTGLAPDGNHFCVGSAARGLAERGYRVSVLADACGPLGQRIEECRADLESVGVAWEGGAR